MRVKKKRKAKRIVEETEFSYEQEMPLLSTKEIVTKHLDGLGKTTDNVTEDFRDIGGDKDGKEKFDFLLKAMTKKNK